MKKKSTENKIKKLLIAITVLLLSAFTGITVVYAWFTGQKDMKTISKINTPINLTLGAGHNESIQQLDLGNIDAKIESHTKKYVFSVSSNESIVQCYRLQLSHTTNIKFTYTIYHSSELGEEEEILNDDILYVGTDNHEYYYRIGEKVQMEVLNPDNNDTFLANQDDYSKTYNEYRKVQKHAKPLYTISGEITPGNTSTFIDYYILEITWEEEQVQNNKETDMVYLMAAVV